ncbi:MAG TPA: ATP-dependent Clp protease proteolytic subunit [Elusimicrobiota bacterium]|nr:ATP-dependent Clp protease proteolytic subunit [Elusimicrobiota bacterium]
MFVPTILEKWNQGSAVGYDIFSRMLKERIIFAGGSEGVVTTDSANLIISQLLYLDAEDPTKEISLYINSAGGMVSAGLAVYDTMQYIRAPVSTLCMGMAMSFGAVLLAAGAKGKRHILPHARVMIHQPLSRGISGQATDIIISAREITNTKKKLVSILSLHTGRNAEKLAADMERNYYMSAQEAKEYGIVDSVVPPFKP